jgi:hypothetical protein
LSRRKPTLLGSKKLHQLYKKATANGRNKAIVAAMMSAVMGIAALFLSSKGGYLENWSRTRELLMNMPGGTMIANRLQQLLDCILRVLGLGIKAGDIVVCSGNPSRNIVAESHSADNPRNLPPIDVTQMDVLDHPMVRMVDFVIAGGENNRNQRFQVKKVINDTRKCTVRLWDSRNQAPGPIITNGMVYGQAVANPPRTAPFEFSIDHWDKVKNQRRENLNRP